MVFKWTTQFRFAPLLVAASAALLYLNTLGNPFVVDDIPYVVENYQIRHLSGILSSFASSYPPDSPSQGLYRPLTNISFGLDYHLWKLDPRGYHLTNLALHALASLAFFYLAAFLLGCGAAPLAASLLFAAHPVHTEAVASVVGRAEVLAALFYFLAFLLYLKARSKSKWAGLALSALSAAAFLAAMLSKEMAATLPLAVILYEKVQPGEARAEASGGSKVPFMPYILYAAAILFYVALKVGAAGRLGPESAQQLLAGLPPFLRAMFVGRAFLYYAKLLFFPAPLSVDYALDPAAVSSPAFASSLGGLILAALLAAAPFYARSRFGKTAAFAGAWFLVSLLPVLNIIPIGALFAERFLYMPLAAFALGCGVALNRLLKSTAGSAPARRGIAAALLLTGLAFYSALTLHRNADWSSERRLWTETARLDPASAKAKNGIGHSFMRESLPDKAMVALADALRLKPNYSAAHNNAGVIYEKKSFLDRALLKYKTALGKDAGYSISRVNAGGVYFAKAMYERAAREYGAVLVDNPNDPVAHKNLGVIYFHKLKSPALAMRHLMISLGVDPDQAESDAMRRALALLKAGAPGGENERQGGNPGGRSNPAFPGGE